MSPEQDQGSRLLVPGWRRYVLALSLGILSALALPPLYAVPLLWPGLAGLALLNFTARDMRIAAFEGWLFGLGWFGVGLYWIGYAFLVDAEQFAALMPVAVIGISVGMALYMAMASAAVNTLMRRGAGGPMVLVPVFAGCWTLSEWLRGILLTGFPWNPLATVWGLSPEMMQPAAYVGALGVSFLTACVFAAPAVLFVRQSSTLGHMSARQKMMAMAMSLLLPLMWGIGAYRLSAAGLLTRDDVVLRLVQPAIDQKLKWRPDLRQQHVLRQMAMSKRTAGPAVTPTDVIWAETNVPFLIEPGSEVPASLAAAVPKDGHLFFGAPRRDAAGRYFNSMFVIDDDGDVVASFDKFHLVPFGEYVPLRDWLPVEKLVAGRGDFTPGPGPQTIKVEGLPAFSPVICYEIIFSGNVVDSDNRPEWILNITNDAWFGPSSGPYQHLVQAQFRAIEEGLPVVRAANTGISAVIDPFGRVRNQLALEKQGVVDAPLPEAIAQTLSSKLAHLGGFLLAVFAVLSSYTKRINARIHKRD
jgi:apolipoprotein N-acyltransferase